MTMWIMRFVPYAGAVTIDGYFRTEARAKDLFAIYSKIGTGRVEFTDDYGIRVSFDPVQGALILTNTEASAAMNKDLNEANHDAARRQGIVPKIATGSTVQ